MKTILIESSKNGLKSKRNVLDIFDLMPFFETRNQNGLDPHFNAQKIPNQ